MPLKFEDYAKRQEEALESEIEQAQEQQQERETQAPETSFEMPAQFRGKTAEEIAQSYIELQQLQSRQANTLGEYRKMVDEHIKSATSTGTHKEPDPEEKQAAQVTIDSLYENADESIATVVRREAGERLERVESAIREQEDAKRMAALDEKYPGWRKTIDSPEFVDYVLENKARQALFVQADQNHDWDAAEELVGNYMLRAQKKAPQADKPSRTPEQEKALRDGTLDSAGGEHVETEATYSRRKLMDLRIRAKHGDEEAARYLSDNAIAINAAYSEGRIKD
jgi:hypothetical protein